MRTEINRLENLNTADVLAEICREDFRSFIPKAFRILEPGNTFKSSWHIDCIAEHLQAQAEGDREVQKLIINLPPRMLKSVLVAQIYPAWLLAREPYHQIIGAAYAHSLAERNVTATRRIIQDEWYSSSFTDTRLSADTNRKDYFTTTKNGQYKGTGIGGTITGFGANTLIADDPINPLEAGSDTIRISANEAIRGTMFSRWNDYSKGRLAMIMQRLHEDDPTGNLMSDGGYHLLKLPAYAPKPITIDLGRKRWKMEEGEYLSERLNKQALDSLQTTLRHNFAGQYLQEPVAVGGGDFKEDWINYFDLSRINPRKMNIVILCDPAGGEELNRKKKKLSDWTAFMVIGLNNDNNYYVLDIIRDKLNPTERVNTLFMLHRKWNDRSGKPPKVGYEKYGMMTDTHYLKKKMMDESYHFSLFELGGNRISKEERIKRLIPDMELGRWYFPERLYYVDSLQRKFDLVYEFVKSEMLNFPRARNDDMIDALSRIYEPELNLVFPRPKLSLVQNAVNRNDCANDSWQDY